ncbi:biotin carboxyl carrier protein of acetyl-CoA carboxylase 2, chloroplastic isoform X1 [Cannabis sativa]|uniref:biotin carboxyl carrier protein of acetyl-CoA carboxylase 2, chloroplastic isoform X1 n=1 Tax=Cannabis sativa TaxID=3483 RepID=UPI0029C9BC89|nr:biotin carboxyl carrier protein of acetyl-CoA carboxylase 2, chloroplastic isoform X1 [Cannabis sativa]
MATFTVPCPKATASNSLGHLGLTVRNSLPFHHPRRLTFQNADNASLSFGFQSQNSKQPAIWKVHAQLNKVAVASNSIPVPPPKSAIESPEEKDESLEENTAHNSVPDPSSIAAFMAQVSDLVKLVDSRDIMELELKQLDCELLIRKKEAIQQPAPPAAPMQTHYPQGMYLSAPPPQAPTSYAPPASPPPSAPAPVSPAPAQSSKSSHPPLKCPMAGTFYRSPAPGEPPFVKVGDKVQKGQVICIIEAMKLMNEIEADQSGTVAEVLAEDGKPVSVDTVTSLSLFRLFICIFISTTDLSNNHCPMQPLYVIIP